MWRASAHMPTGGWHPAVHHLYFYPAVFTQLFAFSLCGKRVKSQFSKTIQIHEMSPIFHCYFMNGSL